MYYDTYYILDYDADIVRSVAYWRTLKDIRSPVASYFVNGHIVYVSSGILAYIGK